MNVLHINWSDSEGGGAAIAAYRLHEVLLNMEVNSRLLVGYKKSKDDRVFRIKQGGRVEKQTIKLEKQFGLNYIGILNTFQIPRQPLFQKADILNFHNLHGNYFNYLALPYLTAQKKAVITLHDMWSFTGHCAYGFNCDRWKIGCGHCPDLESYPAVQRDSTHLEWQLKKWVYRYSHLAVIAPSRWLAEQAKQSLLNRFEIHCIPNGIDTSIYQPLDRQLCRQKWDIPLDKKVIVFGAAIATDYRKGPDLLKKALASLPKALKQDLLLLVLGDSSNAIADELDIPTKGLGYIRNEHHKAEIYSAADLFLFPTRADNLPLMLQESMACGIPSVSFAVGGVPDLVRPGITGLLAQAENTHEFSLRIIEILKDRDFRTYLGHNCRRIALEEYRLEDQAQRYLQLYRQLLSH